MGSLLNLWLLLARRRVADKVVLLRRCCQRVAVVSAAVIVCGCIFSGESTSRWKPPEYAYHELLEHGVTLSAVKDDDNVSTPILVETNTYDYLNCDYLAVVFLPVEKYRHVESLDYLETNFGLQTVYKYTLTIENTDGSFTTIEGGDSPGDQDPYRNFLSRHSDRNFSSFYYGRGEKYGWSHQFQVSGSARIPVAATHIEFWFRDSGENETEFKMVKRVALESLQAYRFHVLPVVQSLM